MLAEPEFADGRGVDTRYLNRHPEVLAPADSDDEAGVDDEPEPDQVRDRRRSRRGAPRQPQRRRGGPGKRGANRNLGMASLVALASLSHLPARWDPPGAPA